MAVLAHRFFANEPGLPKMHVRCVDTKAYTPPSRIRWFLFGTPSL